MVYFMYPDGRWWSSQIPSLPYSFIAAVLLLALTALQWKKYSHQKVSELPQLKWFLALIAIYAVVTPFAIDESYHRASLIALFKTLVLLFIAYKVLDSNEKLKNSIYVYIAGSFYIGLECLRVGRDAMGRVEGVGLIDSPGGNAGAAFMASALVFCLFFFWQGNKKQKVCMAIAGVFILNGLVLINSRGAFLATLASVGLFVAHMLWGKLQEGRQRMSVILLVVFGLSGALYLTDDTFWERMSTLKEVNEDKRKSGSYRTYFWFKTFDMLEGQPIGLGARGYQVLSPMYIEEELLSPQTGDRAVHSTWFQVLSEIGWLGAIVFIGLLVSIFRYSRQARLLAIEKNDRYVYFKLLAAESALLGFMVSGSFIDTFRVETFYWLMFFTIAGAYLYINQYKNGVRHYAENQQ
jgi:hypothetical protein